MSCKSLQSLGFYCLISWLFRVEVLSELTQLATNRVYTIQQLVSEPGTRLRQKTLQEEKMSFSVGTEEGNSMVRPPLFKGTKFSWWKNKMEIFVNAMDVDLWEIIVGGPIVINNKGLDDKGEPVPKPRDAWTKDDKELWL